MHKFLFFVFAALLVLPQVAAGRWRAAAVRVPVDDDCTCNVVLSQESSWGLFQRPLFSVSGGQRRYLSRILRCFPDLAAPPPTFLSLWEPPLEVEQRRGLDRTSWRSPRTPTLPIGHLSGGGGGTNQLLPKSLAEQPPYVVNFTIRRSDHGTEEVEESSVTCFFNLLFQEAS